MSFLKSNSELIKTSYDQNLVKLSLIARRRWALRLYRVTGDKNQIKDITSDFLTEILFFNHFFSFDKSLIKNDNLTNYRFLLKHRYERLRKRAVLHKRFKDELFWGRILERYYWLKSVGLEDFIEKDRKSEILSAIRSVNWGNFLLDKDVLFLTPIDATNYVYALKGLFRDLDFEEEYIHEFKDFYLSQRVNLKENWQQEHLTYGMTHFIIADTDFYQKFTTVTKWNWVLDYFERNIDMIKKIANVDILLEVALCFKLCQTVNSQFNSLVESKIEEDWDFDNNIIFRKEKGSFEKAYHSNGLAFMYANIDNSLYKGPDLKIFLESYFRNKII